MVPMHLERGLEICRYFEGNQLSKLLGKLYLGTIQCEIALAIATSLRNQYH